MVWKNYYQGNQGSTFGRDMNKTFYLNSMMKSMIEVVAYDPSKFIMLSKLLEKMSETAGFLDNAELPSSDKPEVKISYNDKIKEVEKQLKDKLTPEKSAEKKFDYDFELASEKFSIIFGIVLSKKAITESGVLKLAGTDENQVVEGPVDVHEEDGDE